MPHALRLTGLRSGWTILALEPNSFQVVNTHEEFCGAPADNNNYAGYLDITSSLHRIPWHDRSLTFSTSDDDDDEASDIESGDGTTVDGSMVGSPLVEDENPSPGRSDFSLSIESDSSVLHDMQVGSGEKRVKPHHSKIRPALQQPLPMSKGPVIPALHLSASHLRFFDANRPQPPSIYCSELLSFQSPMYHATHPAIDRLNLTQYIPELGIVVIATQIGRVAVCTLTRKGPKGPCGLRVDWIIPFASQEKNHERPLTHLLGIAAGPVQGRQPSRPGSLSVDDEKTERTWLRDRIDHDGVAITFDPEVIRIRRNSDSSSSSSTDDDLPNNATTKPSQTWNKDQARAATGNKRKRTPPPNWRAVKQAWPSRSDVGEASAVMDEPWRGLEYSRRYRLMLTYYDQTVMTYELSRARPFVGDPGVGRPNWRSREEFL